MADTGQLILAELQQIRECLQQDQPLGFGKRETPRHIFVHWHQQGGQDYVWYRREKGEGVNRPIAERDLTGYLDNLWRYDRIDEQTGETIPRLIVSVRADHPYLIQTGFYTNFSKSLLAGLLELEPPALNEPLTLIVETNEGSRHRPTLFCRLERQGKRLKPDLGKERKHKQLYNEAASRFVFYDPYSLVDEGESL